MLTDKALERQIDAERKLWEKWVDRVIKNGPQDQEAAAAVHASTARYQILVNLRRSTTDPWYEEDFSGRWPAAAQPKEGA